MTFPPLAPHLQAVRDAADARDTTHRAANQQLIDAIREAREYGWTMQEIANVLGVTRQAISALLKRRERADVPDALQQQP